MAGHWSEAKNANLGPDCAGLCGDSLLFRDVARLRAFPQVAGAAPSERIIVSSLISSIWPRCLELGLDVVLDMNFWSRADRDTARRLSAEVGAECWLYRLRVPDDVALERIARRNLEPDQLQISPATFELLKGRFEPLEGDEAVIEVGGADEG